MKVTSERKALKEWNRLRLLEALKLWKSKGPEHTQAKLAEIIGCEQRAFSDWKAGKYAITDDRIASLIEAIGLPEDFFVPSSLRDYEIGDDSFHEAQNRYAEQAAKRAGVSEAFVRYIGAHEGLVSWFFKASPVDSDLNSLDPTVHASGSPYQYCDRQGRKAYLSEQNLQDLAVLEEEVSHYVIFRLMQHSGTLPFYDDGGEGITATERNRRKADMQDGWQA